MPWPKERPELPDAYQAIYERHHVQNRTGGGAAIGIAQRLESWMHRMVADDVARAGRGGATLEIGAGTLNQLPYEPNTSPYDVVEPFDALYETSLYRSRIRHRYRDIADVPDSNRYDRITSIATFEHVLDLPDMVRRAAMLLSPTGVMRVAIPSEGEFLWGLAWRLTTGIEFRLRHGLDYGVMMRYEHVNTATEIERVLRERFGAVSLATFGVGRSLSLYQCLVCTDPRR
jgi:hypothetical protein